MRPRDVIALVVRREMGDRLGNRAFLVTTAISVLAIVAIIVVPGLFDDDGPTTWDVGVLAGAALPDGFDDTLVTIGDASDAEVTVSEVDDRADADTAITDGDLDAVVLDDQTVLADDLPGGLERAIEQSLATAGLADALEEAGVDPSGLDLLDPDLVVVTPDGQDEQTRETALGLGFIVTILLFLTLQINGASLLTTTVEEKSSRVVEVLLATVRPWQMLSGKLLAMTLLSVGQLVLYAVAGLGAFSLTGDVSLPDGSPMVVVTSLVMFLLGFGLWGAIYAVAGSLATSAEEAQSSAGPIGFVAAAVYGTVIIGVVPNPDGTLAQVLSFIPLSAPFALPARAAAGVPVWEVVVGAVLTGLGTWLGVRLAGRLYSAAVLSGGRMTWRDAFRAEPIR
ncbi:ABC transporter permease [Salsipaludibacter albus]|uniref:ABC transporter permease n=1 Tax=Salsipaludibacter albus TaxID=2849650 RepID=UPI001EE422F7|nr:ABC transporter permease [Salsipaludibacter albus]MBY5162404.1 ABC transporter permease [Salsipaludibacter albus]